MRVTLISPSISESYGLKRKLVPSYVPLGLAYLAAMLEKQDVQVNILDMGAEGISTENLVDYLPSDTNIVGITCATPTSYLAHRIAGIVKKELPDSWVILGGPHPSCLPLETVEDPNVDVVVIGEGEYTILEIVHAFDVKEELKKIKGIVTKINGKLVQTPRRPLIQNLDELPFPAYHLLPLKKYQYPFNVKRKPLVNIISSRGCPFGCVYCSKAVFGRTFRPRNYVKVVDEIEYLVNKFGVKEIHFSDDVFTLDKKRAKMICDEILRRKIDITWAIPNGIRVDSIDKTLLKKMKKSGCYSVGLGIESGNQEILNRIKKGVTLREVRRAVRLLNEVGIEIWGYFMFGLPGDTEETMRDTIEFAKSLDLTLAKFHVAVPFPGTEFWSFLVENRYLKSTNFQSYAIHLDPVYEYPHLSSETILKYYRTAYKEFYLRPQYLLRSFLKIRSLYDFKSYVSAAIVLVKEQLT